MTDIEKRLAEIRERVARRKGMTNSDLLNDAWPVHYYVRDCTWLLAQLEAARREVEWLTIETAPMYEDIWVAFHGHNENQVKVVQRIKQTGYWGDFDYINSHDGEPKYWMPYIKPEPPDNMDGPDCGCDGCDEKYSDEPVL